MDCGYTERCPPFLEKGQCIQKRKEGVPSFHTKVLGAYRLQVFTRQGFGSFAYDRPYPLGRLEPLARERNTLRPRALICTSFLYTIGIYIYIIFYFFYGPHWAKYFGVLVGRDLMVAQRSWAGLGSLGR
ncbi:hypothetical protein UB51_09810 [Paenibacillus sp. IHBB 10380]|nr:hypothetical protein UB51_09810 [Paenibacillus sp. IHBB 10380]